VAQRLAELLALKFVETEHSLPSYPINHLIFFRGNITDLKTKFKVVKSKESATTSGNRCIVAWHKEAHFVSILLVYGKTDLGGGNETVNWKNLVRGNYNQYSKMV
jgi:hypothetical protein